MDSHFAIGRVTVDRDGAKTRFINRRGFSLKIDSRHTLSDILQDNFGPTGAEKGF